MFDNDQQSSSKFSINISTPPMCLKAFLRLVVSSCITETVGGCWTAPRKNKRGNRLSDFSQSIRELLETQLRCLIVWNDWIQTTIKKQKGCLFLRRIRCCRCWHRVPTHASNSKSHVWTLNAQENRVKHARLSVSSTCFYCVSVYVCVCVNV